jgi:hypothetical protein
MIDDRADKAYYQPRRSKRVRTSAAYPVLERIGTLPFDAAVAGQVLAPTFSIGGVTNSIEVPKALADLLVRHGWSIRDEDGTCMLFASTAGVPLHVDEHPSALWVVGGHMNIYEKSHMFVVGDHTHDLQVGDVLVFDARMRHGLIAATNNLWAVASVYIEHLDA